MSMSLLVPKTEPISPDLRELIDTSPYRVSNLLSSCGRYEAFRENYRIYMFVDKIQHDITPDAKDVYISDWAFTPDSTMFIYIDQLSKRMYALRLDALNALDALDAPGRVYRFGSLAEYDEMTIRTTIPEGEAIWEINHIVLVNNQHAVVLTHPSKFIVYSLRDHSAPVRHYICNDINEAIFPELDVEGKQLSFVKYKDRSLRYILDL
jgi:hypothetical protein